MTVPTIFRGPGDLPTPESLRPVFFIDAARGEMIQQVLSFPKRQPFYFSAFFRSTYDPSSPYLLKSQIFPKLPVSDAILGLSFDVEASRYPLIHELSGHLRVADGTFADLTMREQEVQKSLLKLQEWLTKGNGKVPPGAEKDFETERKKLKRNLQEMRQQLSGLDEALRTLERWALQDGKDKAVSREAALDMVFNLFRANEVLTNKAPSERVDASYELLRDTQARRFHTSSVPGSLNFGLAAIDINITGTNSVSRRFGDIVLDLSLESLRKHFAGSVVSKGTRTNFRVVNPNGNLLTQDMLLKLEKDIHNRVLQRAVAEGNPGWKTFAENYQPGISAGYSEVQFKPSEIRVGASGEYDLESVNSLLAKVDYNFRVANARSQEIVDQLKQADSLQDSTKVERLNYGQMNISELNGIPEGRYLEPGEEVLGKPSAVRLVHNVKGLGESLKALRTHWNSVDRFADNPAGQKESLRDVLTGTVHTLQGIQTTANQYYSVNYDVSHDLRMPRLIERSFAAERVDTVIRETGGAKLLFVELGKFYSFVRSWYGGNQDKYVHELINEFNKVLVGRGMVITHPANQAPLLDEKGEIAVDPKNGQYFEMNGVKHDSVSGIRMLRNPQTSFPVGSEVVLTMREGDELGFVVGDKKVDGQPVTKEEIREVFEEFEKVIRAKYGDMFLDDVEKVQVGADKVRTPNWQRLDWQQGKNAHIITGKNILKQEADVTAEYSGWVVDYVPVKEGAAAPTAKVDGDVTEASDVVVGRRMRWRFFENGEATNKVFLGDTFRLADPNAAKPTLDFPEEIRQQAGDLLQKPILAKMQTTLSAGYVSVEMHSGAQLDSAWEVANDLSKKSKEKGGVPLFVQVPPKLPQKPQGHNYDKSVSSTRSREVAAYFESYAQPEAPKAGKAMSPELKKFLASNGPELGRLMDPLAPKSFEKQLLRILKNRVQSEEQQEQLRQEVEAQLKEGGALTQVRDGFAVVQILKREGLSLDYEKIGPALWTALDLAEKAVGNGKASAALQESKSRFVKLYVQQTGNLPPEEILAESRKYIDPKSVFIPEEIFSLAKQYKVAPERVPYLVAGLKADEIRKMGQEAFRSLTYEDLKKLADSPEGQAFLKEPKNALLLQDTLKTRAAFQGVPLVTSMLMVFPSEMICKYLAEKIGASRGWSRAATEELKFGMTLYFVHFFNVSVSGAWEVVMNRYASNAAMAGGRAFSAALGTKVNGGILQGVELAGQNFMRVGLKTGDGLGKAVWEGLLEKWGFMEAGAFSWRLGAWQTLKGIPRVPFNLLRTMGAGYLSATIFEKASGIWLKPDHPIRKYGSFVAFFAPDIVRLALGSSRIAASPFLTRAGGLFTTVGNRLLAIAILNYGVRRLVIDSDYDSWVNRRVADKIFDENVYKLDGNDWFVLPLALKGVRAGARFLAPDAIDWSVAVDESDLREGVLKGDLKNSSEITSGIKELLPKLLASPASFDATDPESYHTVDFSILTKPIQLNDQEKTILKKMSEQTGEVSKEAFAGIPEDRLEKSLQRIQFYQIQQGARFLVAVGQKDNDWARDFFNEDGTLKEGKGDIMLNRLLPAKDQEPQAIDKLLTSRQVMVGLALLDNKDEFLGHRTLDLGQIAGLVDDHKKYIYSPALYASLALYTSQAYQSKDPKSIARVQELVGKLQLAYLRADEKERPKYFEAMQCLGVQP